MKPKIMVVDDQEVVMEQICDFLEWVGCEVVGKAKNGKEALEVYKKVRPEMVTMDIIMPVMDGIEATEDILDFDPDAKVLIFTSLDVSNDTANESSMVKRAIEHGAIGATCKFSKTGIAEELKKIFSDRVEL